MSSSFVDAAREMSLPRCVELAACSDCAMIQVTCEAHVHLTSNQLVHVSMCNSAHRIALLGSTFDGVWQSCNSLRGHDIRDTVRHN